MNCRYWFQRHPKVTVLVFAILGCLSLIIVTEFSARLLLPEWAPTREERVKFWHYDELLGWAHKPNGRARFNHRDFSVEVVINSHGMRDSEYSLARTAKRRMLILGDSFGWGFGVEHHERFSEVLEDAHPDWEILNASVSGYGTDQEFLVLRDRLLAFKPDIVLLLFYENDFSDNRINEAYWHFKPLFSIERGQLELQNVPVPKPTISQRLDRFFYGRTYLGRAYHDAKNSWLTLTTHIKDYLRLLLRPLKDQNTGKSDKNSPDKRSVYELTDQLIKNMNALCKDNGSAFVLVSVPMDTEKRGILHMITEEYEIPYLALDAQFESTASPVTFPHDAHWNAKGHKLAADAIETFLREVRIFNAPSLNESAEDRSVSSPTIHPTSPANH
jgi:hypothetical protein